MKLTVRQTEFADAGLRLLALDGMAAVSFRSVAAEVGMSLGAVQKAFPTKDALVGAMFHRMREKAAPRALADPGRPTLKDWLASLLMEILPLDPERRAAELQGAAFAERAAFDPVIGDAIAASDRELRAALVGLVRREQSQGRLRPDLDADAAVWTYWTITQGMATQLLYDPLTEERARARVRWAIDALFD